jgi:predicted  nucleic acid-binding Zn-ribbon protein
MIPELERLIRLQQIDSFIDSARRRVADHPSLVAALDTKLASANQALAAAKQKVAENRTARAAVEKDLAMIQGRLSKFRDQLMEVKTNKEYQAMQKEIEVAQHDVRRLEDKILERMLEADELTAAVKAAEAGLARDQAAIVKERAALEQETERLRSELDKVAAERADVVGRIPPALLGTYETLMKGRRGLAVVEARDYLCTACNVRLRPQVFNEIRRGDTIHQCGSCQRILYMAPADATPNSAPDTTPNTAPSTPAETDQ